MGFYDGLLYLKRNGCLRRIRHFFTTRKGYVDDDEIPGEFYMVINSGDFLEEKVKTIIHECWHFAPEFIEYDGRNRDEEIEAKIERRTQEMYENSPVLVRCLREAVENKSSLGESIWRVCRDLNLERKSRIFNRDCQTEFDFMKK